MKVSHNSTINLTQAQFTKYILLKLEALKLLVSYFNFESNTENRKTRKNMIFLNIYIFVLKLCKTGLR